MVPNPSGGTAAGLNAAIAASRGSVLARCDAQSRFPRHYLRRAVEILAETGADNVGGTQAAEGTTFVSRAVAIAQTTFLGVGDARYRTGGQAGPGGHRLPGGLPPRRPGAESAASTKARCATRTTS